MTARLRRQLFEGDEEKVVLIELTIVNTLRDILRDMTYLREMTYTPTSLPLTKLNEVLKQWTAISNGPDAIKALCRQLEGGLEAAQLTAAPTHKFTLAMVRVAMKGRPLVEMALDPTIRYQTFFNVCAVCRANCTSKCARCGVVFYCGSAHQRGDWKRHKSMCTAIIYQNP